MQLYLIRHGASAGDSHARVVPPVSEYLSEDGQIQVKQLGESFEELDFDCVVSSPLGRAVQTAQCLRNKQKEIELAEWVRERGTKPIDPQERRGESVLETQLRVAQGWQGFAKRMGFRLDSDGRAFKSEPPAIRLAIVAHGGSLYYLVSYLLDFPLRHGCPINFLNTGVALISWIPQWERAEWMPSLWMQPLARTPAESASQHEFETSWHARNILENRELDSNASGHETNSISGLD